MKILALDLGEFNSTCSFRHRFRTLREEQLTAGSYRMLWIHSLTEPRSDDAVRVNVGDSFEAEFRCTLCSLAH